jgi:hypothetical protein
MRLSVLFVLALATLPAAAQQRLLPDNPDPKPEVALHDPGYRFAEVKIHPVKVKTLTPSFFLVSGALGASATADYITSTHWKPGQYETNPILGRHPSNADVVAFGSVYFTGEVGLAYFLKRYGQRHSWAKYFWLIEPTAQTISHARCAYLNSQLP